MSFFLNNEVFMVRELVELILIKEPIVTSKV